MEPAAPDEEAAPATVGKRKLSRKQQLKEARAQKKERSLDPTYRPARKEDDADDIDRLPVEQPGAASKRNADDDNKCCCQRMLSTQPDFSSECSALQHAVETPVMIEGVRCLRHLCFFLPKFHCELNWIERMWGASKAYARAHCAYTLQGLRETVPLSLSQISVTWITCMTQLICQ